MAAFVAAGAFLVLVYYCIQYVQSPVSTTPAYSMTYEDTAAADAFIVRDETVYEAPAGGTFYSYEREGARVGRNRALCAVYSGSVDESVLQELASIDAKLSEISSGTEDDSTFMSGSSTAKRLLQLEEEIEAAAAENDIVKIASCKAEIASLAAGEAVKTASQTSQELATRRASLEAGITSPKSDIISTVSGIYSQKVDGYEQVLTPAAIENINVEQFGAIAPEQTPTQPQTDGKKQPESSARIVSAGQGICKVIDNHEWYIAALVKRADIEDVKTGQKVGIRLGKLPSEQLEAMVLSISSDPKGQEKAVLVLECDSYSEGAFSIRASDVEIIKVSYSGICVPVHSIRVSDGQSGVMVRNGGRDVFKPCKIIYRNEDTGMAIVAADTDDQKKTLREFDMIVTGEK